MHPHAILICSTIILYLTEITLSQLLLVDPDSLRNVSELISSKGYPVEDHNVITKDGYVLAIQRIPRGRGQNANELPSSKTPVLFHHGFLGAASDYVINFPHQSLGFILADAGYDVWLGNFRGNTYSSHINLSRDAREFWDFSADEMASEDLPSTIDTVLKITGKEKLQYIGWSQGALIMFALLSEKPEYNKKISLFSAMAPAVYLGHFHAPLVLLVPFAELIRNSATTGVNGPLLATNPTRTKAANGVCGNNIGDEICTAMFAYLTGLDSNQLNKSRLSVYFCHSPAGTSINDALHLAQLVRCNCFEKFDYGISKNIAKYGKPKPPGYMLSRAKVPVAIYWSKGDWFAAEEDVAHLRKELTNVVEYYQVPEEKFTHFDFGWGINAEPILYRKMMSVMKNFRT